MSTPPTTHPATSPPSPPTAAASAFSELLDSLLVDTYWSRELCKTAWDAAISAASKALLQEMTGHPSHAATLAIVQCRLSALHTWAPATPVNPVNPVN